MAYIGNNPKVKSIVSTGDSLANLTAETRREGRLVYANDVPNKGFYYDDGTSLLPIDTTSVYNLLTQDEGVDVNTSTVAIDFVGGGVTATDAGAGKTTVTIPLASITTAEEGVDVDTTATKLNFVGDGVTATDAGGGETTVTISGGGSSLELSVSVADTSGFSVLDPVYHNGTTWLAADTADVNTLADYVITEIINATDMKIAKFGQVTATAHGLTVGQHYFQNGTGYGPTEDSSFSVPLFYVLDANTILLQLLRPAAKGALATAIDLAWTAVVGDATDVANGDATHSTIAAAVTDAVAGGRITLLSKTFTENLVLTKEVHFFGSGAASVIDGTIQFSAGSSRSSAEKLKFNGNITVDSGVTKLILNNGWIANTASLTDNNATSDDSLYTLVED